MAHIIQDDGNLCLDAERVDLNTLCVTGTIDTGNLCTEFSDDIIPPVRYRADTTIITADNITLTADYSF
jgi:hypothetical protein